MERKQVNRLTKKDLMERWKCSYDFALNFMHRKGSGAMKVGKLIVVDEKEVERYELSKKLRQA